jgi:hypothetical protein
MGTSPDRPTTQQPAQQPHAQPNMAQTLHLAMYHAPCPWSYQCDAKGRSERVVCLLLRNSFPRPVKTFRLPKSGPDYSVRLLPSHRQPSLALLGELCVSCGCFVSFLYDRSACGCVIVEVIKQAPTVFLVSSVKSFEAF